jgi:hypothetical protein
MDNLIRVWDGPETGLGKAAAGSKTQKKNQGDQQDGKFILEQVS